MNEIFNSHPAYFLMAAFGTILFLIKTLLMFFGSDSSGDMDFETGPDSFDHPDGGDQFTLISVQSILAFFMGAGWMGLTATIEWKLGQIQSILSAFTFGFLMMCLSSYLSLKMKSLNSIKKNFNMKNAIGLSGKSYTKIPAKGDGDGQIEIVIQGKQQIINVQSISDPIEAFKTIIIKDVDDSGRILVEQLKGE